MCAIPYHQLVCMCAKPCHPYVCIFANTLIQFVCYQYNNTIPVFSQGPQHNIENITSLGTDVRQNSLANTNSCRCGATNL